MSAKLSAELPIPIPHDLIVQFCQHDRILKLSFFGSVLRKDFRSDSDIDILVEFEPGKTFFPVLLGADFR